MVVVQMALASMPMNAIADTKSTRDRHDEGTHLVPSKDYPVLLGCGTLWRRWCELAALVIIPSTLHPPPMKADTLITRLGFSPKSLLRLKTKSEREQHSVFPLIGLVNPSSAALQPFAPGEGQTAG
jgi:hypothetical protein